MMGAMVREKIERERERGLQDYLNAVLERCTDDQCLLLAKFLRVNKHLNTPVDACENCAPGTFADVPGLTTCESCDEGRRRGSRKMDSLNEPQ